MTAEILDIGKMLVDGDRIALPVATLPDGTVVMTVWHPRSIVVCELAQDAFMALQKEIAKIGANREQTLTETLKATANLYHEVIPADINDRQAVLNDLVERSHKLVPLSVWEIVMDYCIFVNDPNVIVKKIVRTMAASKSV